MSAPELSSSTGNGIEPFAPGAAVAWLSNSAPIIDERVVIRVKLIGSARRPVEWQVVEESVEIGDQSSISEREENAVEVTGGCEMPA